MPSESIELKMESDVWSSNTRDEMRMLLLLARCAGLFSRGKIVFSLELAAEIPAITCIMRFVVLLYSAFSEI